jgi:hypothetical protein
LSYKAIHFRTISIFKKYLQIGKSIIWYGKISPNFTLQKMLHSYEISSIRISVSKVSFNVKESFQNSDYTSIMVSHKLVLMQLDQEHRKVRITQRAIRRRSV